MRFYGGGIGHQQGRGLMPVPPTTTILFDDDETDIQKGGAPSREVPPQPGSSISANIGTAHTTIDDSSLEDEEQDFGYVVSSSEDEEEDEDSEDIAMGEDTGELSGSDEDGDLDLGPEDGEDPVDEDELVYMSVGLRRK